MSAQALREFINRHNTSATGIAALGAALDAQATGTPLDPTLAPHIQALLEALGVGDVLDNVSPQEALTFVAELRFICGVEMKLLHMQSRKATGTWKHTEPEILQAGGDVSIAHAQGLTRMVAPALEGMVERLKKPGATFLDVGTGVGGLSIAMCRLWPELRCVGVDPWRPSLALARENVDKADLAARIELRELVAENLTDEKAFDLAWVPSVFMPERSIPAACERVAAALRPGGWMVFVMTNPHKGDRVAAAATRLRTALFGGGLFTTDHIETVLRDKGLVDVHCLPTPPGALVAFVAGRRPA